MRLDKKKLVTPTGKPQMHTDRASTTDNALPLLLLVRFPSLLTLFSLSLDERANNLAEARWTFLVSSTDGNAKRADVCEPLM